MPGSAKQSHQQVVAAVRRQISAHLFLGTVGRCFAVAALLTLGARLLAPSAPAQAQDGCEPETYDFTTSEAGWEGWSDGSFFNPMTYSSGWNYTGLNDVGSIALDFGEERSMCRFIIEGVYTGTLDVKFWGMPDYHEIALTVLNDGAATPFTIDNGTFGLYTVPYEGALISSACLCSFSVTITSVEIWYQTEEAPGLIRPLSAADEDPEFTMTDWSDQELLIHLWEQLGLGLEGVENTVEAFSQTDYANVYAADGGTVTFARLNNCGDFCVTLAPPEPDDPVFDTYKLHDDNNLYLVNVDLDGIEALQYIVRDADQYLVQGMTIEAGCILGKTIAIEPKPDIFTQPAPDVEVTLVVLVTTDDQTAHELLPLLTEYPTEAEACNADPRFADCLATNPRFLGNGDGWYTTGGVTFGTVADAETGTLGGATLQPGAEIYTNVILPTDEDLTLNTNVQVAVDGVVQLWIGSTRFGFPVSASSTYQTLELPPDIPTGSIGGGGTLFEVGIKNLTDGVIKITHLCVTGEAPGSTPGQCYFRNPGFDLGDSYWETDGEADPGYLLLDDMETVSQPVSIEPGDYRITAVMEINYLGFTPPETGEVKLTYEFPEGDGFNDLGTVSVTDPGFELLTFTDEFTLADAVDDVMTFRAEVQEGADEDVKGILLDSLCLESLDGPYPPPPGGGGIVDPPFTADCQVVIRPAGDAPVQRWLIWHWDNLNKFFQCDLMVFLNQLYVQVVNALNTILKVARFWIIAGQRYAAWIGSEAIPWLQGHFNNIAQGRTTIVTTQIGDTQCHDLICLLTTIVNQILSPLVDAVHLIVETILGLITQVVSLLLSVVTALVALIFLIFGTVIQFVMQLIHYLQSLVGLFNNVTPIPLPGIPNCEIDPAGNAVCIALYMIQYTIFDPTSEGALYIPLLIGFMSIHLLLWLVDTFRREIANLGDKL